MYCIAEGDPRGLDDVARFVDLINDVLGDLGGFFDNDTDIFVSRAPGRLDVMGGIGDYSGSYVLEMPIAEATLAAVQTNNDDVIKIVSLSRDRSINFTFEMVLSQLPDTGDPREYEDVRADFAKDPSEHWASYAAGVFFVLALEKAVDFNKGARILISSNIPIGKGVSSSAALEVAVMNAICAAYEIRIEPRELAMLCQKVENKIVGASCGVMDQMSTNCGVENALISIMCQPAEIVETVKIPESVEFWGIDSGVRHAVVGSDYSSVRTAAFMGYRIIADIAGMRAVKMSNGIIEIEDPRWHGYLCNVTQDEYESEFISSIPTTMLGSDFLQKYAGTTDRVTRVDAAKTYNVKASTEHAIRENARVKTFSDMLKGPIDDTILDQLGELMFLCHASYAACGLTESGTDRLVELVRENRANGLHGARITGGGSGGTVAILARANCGEIVAKIASRYQSETGRKPYVIHGSSPGGAAFGHLRLGNRENPAPSEL